MKAIVYHRHGSPDVLRFEEIEKPTAGEKEVLLKVRAASVNPYDWHFMRDTPYLVRMMAGLHKPKTTRPGADVAGQVEAVGRNVAQFKRGDDVFENGHLSTINPTSCHNSGVIVTLNPVGSDRYSRPDPPRRQQQLRRR
jgi:NADPH:quinone reductase-like Zn-dependent oxidoreductase